MRLERLLLVQDFLSRETAGLKFWLVVDIPEFIRIRLETWSSSFRL